MDASTEPDAAEDHARPNRFDIDLGAIAAFIIVCILTLPQNAGTHPGQRQSSV